MCLCRLVCCRPEIVCCSAACPRCRYYRLMSPPEAQAVPLTGFAQQHVQRAQAILCWRVCRTVPCSTCLLVASSVGLCTRLRWHKALGCLLPLGVLAGSVLLMQPEPDSMLIVVRVVYIGVVTNLLVVTLRCLVNGAATASPECCRHCRHEKPIRPIPAMPLLLSMHPVAHVHTSLHAIALAASVIMHCVLSTSSTSTPYIYISTHLTFVLSGRAVVCVSMHGLLQCLMRCAVKRTPRDFCSV